MQLIKLYKPIIHVYAKNKELQFSFYGCGDYDNYDDAKCKIVEWCHNQNVEAGYVKYKNEVVTLYGECEKW